MARRRSKVDAQLAAILEKRPWDDDDARVALEAFDESGVSETPSQAISTRSRGPETPSETENRMRHSGAANDMGFACSYPGTPRGWRRSIRRWE